MHSAEHLLNQTMVRMFNCGRSFNAHLEKKKSKCDYHFDRELSSEELSQIEERVNEQIGADLSVSDGHLSFEEAKEQYDLGKLPEEIPDTIRIVKIGDYDACACIGAHVKSTAEIGSFRIVSSSFNENVLRIRFKLGSCKEIPANRGNGDGTYY